MRYKATAMKRAAARTRPVVELTFACLFFLAAVMAPSHARAADAVADDGSTATANETYGHIPIHFQVNQGQAPDYVRYLARGNGYTIYLGTDEAYLVLSQGSHGDDLLRMQIVGANAQPASEPQGKMAARINYLRGNDESKWIRGIDTYARAYFKDVYEGIDLVYYGTDQRRLEYDFVVAAGADPSHIRLNFEGPTAKRVNEAGELVLTMSQGDVQMQAPYVYQDIDGETVEVASAYRVLEDNTIGFELGHYDTSRELVIDPVIVYGSYLGGVDGDVANDVAVDKYGQAYVVGYTKSGNFPTKDPIQFNNFFPGGSDYDIFVSKISADGATLMYATYIGGSDSDEGRGIAVDKDQHVYITGKTTSEDFPIVGDNIGGLDDELDGKSDAFLIKIDNDLDYLKYSTYYGGGHDDEANKIVLDGDEAYIVGSTTSSNLREKKNSRAGDWDAFVARFHDDGAVRWSKYVGGDEDDFGNDIALDSGDEPHIVGTTSSDSDKDEFPITPGAIQSLYSGGSSDAFVAHLNDSSDPEFKYVTYLGGSGNDTGNGIDIDDVDDVYLVGATTSKDFSGAGALHVFDNKFDGSSDGYLTKLRVTGIDPLLYTNFIGGDGSESSQHVAVDSQKRAHVVSTTTSNGYPTTEGPSFGGAKDVLLTIFESDGGSLVSARYFGGDGVDDGLSIALDDVDDNYVVGYTKSDDLPMTGPQADFGGGATDGFIVKFGINADLRLTKEVSDSHPLVGDVVTYTITVNNDGPDDVSLFSVTDALPPGVVFESKDEGDFDCSGSDVVTCKHGFLAAGASASFTVTVEVRASTTIDNCAAIDHPYQDSNEVNNEGCSGVIPQEQTTFWRNANTEAGTVTALAHTDGVPPLKSGGKASGTVLVGTDGGGVYRSTDGGDNWYPTSIIRTGVQRHVRGIAVDPSDGNIFVALFGDGVWKLDAVDSDYEKVNGSSSHDLSGQDRDLQAIVINNFHPNDSDGKLDGDIFVASAGKGVFVSRNDGRKWYDFNGSGATKLGNTVVRSLALMNGNITDDRDWIFAGTHGGGVYRSRTGDGKDAWTAINFGLTNLIVHALIADGNTLYAGTNEGIFKSTDPKAAIPTWTKEPIFDPGYWMPEIVVRSFTLSKDGDLYAGTDGAYIFLKEFGDTEWKWTGKKDASNTWQYNLGLQSSTIFALLAAPNAMAGGPDIIFAGTQDHGVHRMNEEEVTWEQVSNETLNAVIQAMTFINVPGKHDRLFGGTYGFGVVMSDDFNKQPFVNWTTVNKGLDNHWVYALEHLERNDLFYMFAGTWNGGVYRSTDLGENWMFSGLANRIVYDLAIDKNDVIFAATDHGEVARSVDQGLIWQEIGVATTAIWSLGIGHSVMYAGTFGSGVYKSVDNGITWTRTGMREGYVFDFAFGENPETNKNGVFAATATGVKFSPDGGETWSDLSTGLTVPDVRSIAVHPDDDDLLIAGTWGGGIFTYDEDARSWIRDGLPQMPVTSFAINPTTGEVFAGTQDGGLFRKNYASTSSVGTEEPDDELPAAFALNQNYPNPFNPSTRIEFSLPTAQDVRLAVFDALGRQVDVLVDGTMSAGAHSVTFDAGTVSSGVYFYRLDSASESMTRKMILMK